MSLDQQQPWRLRAACRGSADPDAWYAKQSTPQERKRLLYAKQKCVVCPVQKQCGEYAEENQVPYGIWAGKRRTIKGVITAKTQNTNANVRQA